MSIFHYFSSDSDKRSRFIFNTIASIYQKIDFSTSSHYLYAVAYINSEVGIAGKSVLDVGTGTGDWAAMFAKFGATEIHGVDFAKKMVSNGNIKHSTVNFSLGNAENLANFKDNSFDIVTASFVVHGVKQSKRAKILGEMARISKSHIILHDFLGKTPLFIKLLEFLEQSDYKHFKTNIKTELENLFSNATAFKIKKGTGIYISNLQNAGANY